MQLQCEKKKHVISRVNKFQFHFTAFNLQGILTKTSTPDAVCYVSASGKNTFSIEKKEAHSR